jgi:hypothetical protein
MLPGSADEQLAADLAEDGASFSFMAAVRRMRSTPKYLLWPPSRSCLRAPTFGVRKPRALFSAATILSIF